MDGRSRKEKVPSPLEWLRAHRHIDLVPKGQRKRGPSQDGEKEADELRVDRKRRTRTEVTTSQRAFIMGKRQTRTARGHILL